MKRGAARVTYKGDISGFPDAFKWDVDLTFPVSLDKDLPQNVTWSQVFITF